MDVAGGKELMQLGDVCLGSEALNVLRCTIVYGDVSRLSHMETIVDSAREERALG